MKLEELKSRLDLEEIRNIVKEKYNFESGQVIDDDSLEKLFTDLIASRYSELQDEFYKAINLNLVEYSRDHYLDYLAHLVGLERKGPVAARTKLQFNTDIDEFKCPDELKRMRFQFNNYQLFYPYKMMKGTGPYFGTRFHFDSPVAFMTYFGDRDHLYYEWDPMNFFDNVVVDYTDFKMDENQNIYFDLPAVVLPYIQKSEDIKSKVFGVSPDQVKRIMVIDQNADNPFKQYYPFQDYSAFLPEVRKTPLYTRTPLDQVYIQKLLEKLMPSDIRFPNVMYGDRNLDWCDALIPATVWKNPLWYLLFLVSGTDLMKGIKKIEVVTDYYKDAGLQTYEFQRQAVLRFYLDYTVDDKKTSETLILDDYSSVTYNVDYFTPLYTFSSAADEAYKEKVLAQSNDAFKVTDARHDDLFPETDPQDGSEASDNYPKYCELRMLESCGTSLRRAINYLAEESSRLENQLMALDIEGPHIFDERTHTIPTVHGDPNDINGTPEVNYIEVSSFYGKKILDIVNHYISKDLRDLLENKINMHDIIKVTRSGRLYFEGKAIVKKGYIDVGTYSGTQMLTYFDIDRNIDEIEVMMDDSGTTRLPEGSTITLRFYISRKYSLKIPKGVEVLSKDKKMTFKTLKTKVLKPGPLKESFRTPPDLVDPIAVNFIELWEKGIIREHVAKFQTFNQKLFNVAQEEEPEIVMKFPDPISFRSNKFGINLTALENNPNLRKKKVEKPRESDKKPKGIIRPSQVKTVKEKSDRQNKAELLNVSVGDRFVGGNSRELKKETTPQNRPGSLLLETIPDSSKTLELLGIFSDPFFVGKLGIDFSTDWQANDLTEITMEAEAEIPGEVGNGYKPGEVCILNSHFDMLFFLDKEDPVKNLTFSSGGYELEDDDPFRERIKRGLDRFSTAGSEGSYEFWVRSAHPDIIDVSVFNPEPGKVEVYPYTVNGAPNEEIMSFVEDELSKDTRIPVTDTVKIVKPEPVFYEICAEVMVLEDYDVGEIESSIMENLKAYREEMRSMLGRDIVPRQIIGEINSVPGVYRVALKLNIYKKELELKDEKTGFRPVVRPKLSEELTSDNCKVLTRKQWAECLNVDIKITDVIDD